MINVNVPKVYFFENMTQKIPADLNSVVHLTNTLDHWAIMINNQAFEKNSLTKY